MRRVLIRRVPTSLPITSSARFSYKHIEPMAEVLADTGHINYRSRTEMLNEAIANPDYDVLIIGGGATGAGALLSASRKGLRTLLIDAHDFAGGTSSKSTKLLHGGLRYLENAFKLRNKNRMEDFHLVNEAINERNILLNNIPYLSEQVGMIIPLTNIFEAVYYYCGCMLYHQIANITKNGPLSVIRSSGTMKYPFQVSPPRIIGRGTLRSMVPSLSQKFKYGVVLYDGQTDDSAMVIDSVLTATAMKDPAVKSNEALNYTRLINFIKNAQDKITGARIVDQVSGKEFVVNCKVAINAAGIFADQLKLLANLEAITRLAFAKGDHITLNNSNEEVLPHKLRNVGVFIPKTPDGRVMFVLPWLNSVIAGTTDKIVPTPQIHPHADNSSVNEILRNVKQYFPRSEMEVVSKWSGIRPLVKDIDSATAKAHRAEANGEAPPVTLQTKDLKRVHVIDVDEKTDLISIYGGKLTIFRIMGEDAVDQALALMLKKQQISSRFYNDARAKSTDNLHFIGDFRPKISTTNTETLTKDPLLTHFTDRSSYIRFLTTYLEVMYPFVEEDITQHLAKRYGHRAVLILDEMVANKNKAVRLQEGSPYTRAEIEHIAKNEFVVHPIDLLIRRLRVSFLEANLAKKLLVNVIDVFAELNGWTEEQKEREYAKHLELLEQMEF
jgi:glycerol-3-phosphate dehydrogenase